MENGSEEYLEDSDSYDFAGLPDATVLGQEESPRGESRQMLGDPQNYLAVIKVVGIGGGGGNAVNRMIDAGLKGVEFVAVNTDAQALLISDADVKLDIGRQLTRGLGAGSDPDVGRQAAEDHRDEIEEVLKGSDMVFITAGVPGDRGNQDITARAKSMTMKIVIPAQITSTCD